MYNGRCIHLSSWRLYCWKYPSKGKGCGCTDQLVNSKLRTSVWVDPHVIHNHCCKGDLLTQSACIYIYININRYIDIFITSLSSKKIKQYKIWLLCEQISYFKGMATPLQNSKVRTFPVDAFWNDIEIPQHDVHAWYICIYIPTYSCIMIVVFTWVHEYYWKYP